MHAGTAGLMQASRPSRSFAAGLASMLDISEYLLHSVQGGAVASHAASDDDQIVVVLVVGSLGDDRLADTDGAAPGDGPPA